MAECSPTSPIPPTSRCCMRSDKCRSSPCGPACNTLFSMVTLVLLVLLCQQRLGRSRNRPSMLMMWQAITMANSTVPLDRPAATSIGASSVSSGVRNCWQYSYPQECCRYEWHKRAASRPNRSRAELSGQLDICGPRVELQGHGKLASTNRPPVSLWTVRMPTTLVNLEQRSCSRAPSR